MMHARCLGQRLTEEVRHHLSSGTVRSVDLADMAQVWHWEASRTEGETFDVLYLGRKVERAQATSLLLPADATPTRFGRAAMKATGRPTVVMSEAMLPGALRVPGHLRSLIPLRQPLEEILARFDPDIQRHLQRSHAQGYRLVQAREVREVEWLYREMLVPYTRARYGQQVYPLPLETVLRLAHKGRLDVLLQGDTPVGMQLGYSYTQQGTRRYRGKRLGFPEPIFSEPKRWSEVHAILSYLVCRLAQETGHDFLDLGTAPARPDGKLLQLQRQYQPLLEETAPSTCFSVLVPHPLAPQVFRQAPLFSLEPAGLVLHVGVTEHGSEDGALARLRHGEWGGLAAVRLWPERPVDSAWGAELRGRYPKGGPTIEAYFSYFSINSHRYFK